MFITCLLKIPALQPHAAFFSGKKPSRVLSHGPQRLQPHEVGPPRAGLPGSGREAWVMFTRDPKGLDTLTKGSETQGGVGGVQAQTRGWTDTGAQT